MGVDRVDPGAISRSITSTPDSFPESTGKLTAKSGSGGRSRPALPSQPALVYPGSPGNWFRRALISGATRSSHFHSRVPGMPKWCKLCWGFRGLTPLKAFLSPLFRCRRVPWEFVLHAVAGSPIFGIIASRARHRPVESGGVPNSRGSAAKGGQGFGMATTDPGPDPQPTLRIKVSTWETRLRFRRLFLDRYSTQARKFTSTACF